MKKTMILILTVLLSASVYAVQVKLGTATGGLMIYYNNIDVSGANGVPDGVISGYDENSNNQAYVKAQFGYNNTNGSYFQFDNTDLGGFSWNSIFSGQPVGQSQFGFDLQGTSPTYNAAGGVVIPSMFFADNTNNNAANAALTNAIPNLSQAAWAINNYQGGAQSGQLINSLFRGTAFTMSITNFQMVGTQYIMTVSGQLVSDGWIHWYTVGQPDTALASWNLSNTLYYTGTLTYNKNYAAAGWDLGWNTYSGTGMDNGKDQKDFYTGNIDIYVDVIPEPATMGMLALGGLLIRKSKRNSN